MPTIESNLLITDERDQFAIIVSRFNDLVTRRLLDGALETFHRHGAKDEQLTVVWAPGSFELPQLAQHLASSKKFARCCASCGSSNEPGAQTTVSCSSLAP